MIWDNSKRGVFACMLVMIILACHGAYGINHHYVYEMALSHEAGEATPDGDPHHPAGEQATDTGYFTYFMTLLSLLVGLYFLAYKGRSGTLRDSGRCFVQPGGIQNRPLRLPTWSSPPVLQVYRL